MNYSAVSAIIDDNVRLVKCQFSDGGKHYVYKTLLKDLKVGDFVVAQFAGLDDFKIVKVVELESDLEFRDDITYKWVFQKLDVKSLEQLLAAETSMIKEVKQEEMKVKRKQLRVAMGYSSFDSLNTRMLLSNASEARTEEKVSEAPWYPISDGSDARE